MGEDESKERALSLIAKEYGPNMEHMLYLESVALGDVGTLRKKEKTYRGSWKRSGGRSAWFMLKRKIDRMLTMMECDPDETNPLRLRNEHDIFATALMDLSGQDGSMLAEIRDLRQYLTLVEAELKNIESKKAHGH